jgi:uncharacterized protein (DUF58 family)
MVFHGLRGYRPGDSPRSIHWRTSARRGELMVREFEDLPGDDLTLVVEAVGPAGPELEDVISLAATVCWEWCRQTGDRLALAVAGAEPRVVAGVTGRALGLQMLECLALEPGAAAVDREALLARLQEQLLPAGPVLVIRGRPSPLADVLRDGLNRPVVPLDASSDMNGRFFPL